MVIIPNLLYKCKGLPLSNTEIEKIDARLRKLFKMKTGHARDLPTIYLTHENLYNIVSFKTSLAEDAVTNYKERIDKKCMYTIARYLELSYRMLSSESITSNPLITFIPKGFAKYSSILAKAKDYMAQDNITFLPSHHLHNEEQNKLQHQLYPIDKAINDELILALLRDHLHANKIVYLDQLITNDGRKTRTWTEIRRLYTKEGKYNRTVSPNWFQSIVETLITQVTDTIATTNGRYPVDPSTGLGNWNTTFSLNPCYDYNPEINDSTIPPHCPPREINYDIRAKTEEHGYKSKIKQGDFLTLRPVIHQSQR